MIRSLPGTLSWSAGATNCFVNEEEEECLSYDTSEAVAFSPLEPALEYLSVELDDWCNRVGRPPGYIKAANRILNCFYEGSLSLDISEYGLKSLPECLQWLQHLHMLNVRGNELTYLPDFLGELRQLQFLDASVNELSCLPESLGQISELKELYLYSNKIVSLPQPLWSLPHLEELNLSNNRIDSLPEEMALPKLQGLDLSKNFLTDLPLSFGELTSLRNLDLTNNPLSELPGSLLGLSHLCNIELTYTQIKPDYAEKLLLFLQSPAYQGPEIILSVYTPK